MIRLDDVMGELRTHHPEADLDLVRKAYIFSAQAHQGQIRTNGEPYLTHPLEVAYIVSQLRLDTASVCAGLLHDTVEDTDATVEEIEAAFGDDVAFLVSGLTKLEKINFNSREQAQAENFRKMLVAMSRDLRVVLVKLADRTHNMRTLRFLKEEKQKRIAQETIDIYAPLANRMGVNWIKTELEDHCFKYLHGSEYRSLADRIKKTRFEREQYIEKVITLLQKEFLQSGIQTEVTGRPKHLWSIRQKLTKSGRDLDSLFDILAFRVIVEKMPECYEALGLVHSVWKPIPGRFKDYIALPKENGYQSLHTAVLGPEGERIELQFRTHDMHRTAEFGVAAHWAYKADEQVGGGPENQKGFDWLQQLLEWQQDLEDPNDFLNTVKVDLFANEVYVFTPGGDVHAFPRGATPLDFAYTIHTDLGHECTGANINGSQVNLKAQLKNGDVVTIQRTKGNRPKAAWLKFVKTGRAATKIRAFLRQEENERAAISGQELLEKELKRLGLGLGRARKEGWISDALEKLKFQNEREIFVNLGYGKLRLENCIEQIVPEDRRVSDKTEIKENVFQRFVRTVLPKSKGGIIVDGLDGLAIKFPKCCSPVKGDQIFGFVSRGQGVVIHRSDCSRVLDYDPARRVQVQWDSDSRELRAILLRIHSGDIPGLLANISQAFHNSGVNITAVNCRLVGHDKAINNFTIMIQDLEQLNRVVAKIEKLKGIRMVERVDEPG